LGQPMHAFDADTIKGQKVVVKTCAEGTVFKTLDGIERKLSADDLMICNAEEPMTIAGVFGGINSGVTNQTKNIFLESAYFDAVSVRKTAKRHSLKTDASFRFERGTDPNITVFALKYAAQLIVELAGGTVSSAVSDLYPKPIASFIVQIWYKHVSRLIGKEIPSEEIKSIITALDIKITAETNEGLTLEIPPYRVDVTREVDVIEEILRIYGYNNIEIPSQIRASLNNAVKPDKDAVQNMLANSLTANGFNEILANSLTKSSYSEQPETAVKILNPLSRDLDVMRQTLLFSGLEAISFNQNRKNQNLKLYEFGKVYHQYQDKFEEKHRLSLFLSGNDQPEQWNQKETAVNFYLLKGVVDTLLQKAGLKDFTVEDATSAELDFGLNYKIGNKNLVYFGFVSKQNLNKTDVNQPVFYADFDFDLLLRQIGKNKIVYQEVSRFPAVKRDLSLLVNEQISFNQLKNIALKTDRKLIKTVDVFDVYKGDKLPEGKKSYALSFVLQDEEKTLADKAIDAVMQKLVFNLQKEAGAEVRK
ncbi:MAG: phenylalanine--tRNA ligase subunit beta, partial [Sphingobacteriaceae bacterium]